MMAIRRSSLNQQVHESINRQINRKFNPIAKTQAAINTHVTPPNLNDKISLKPQPSV